MQHSARYSRQLPLDGFGSAGQEKLRASSVAVIGAGGLGSAVLPYLAAAGVGKITIVDCDSLCESNLNRQILYTEADLGRSKALCATDRLRALNSEITVTAVEQRLTAENAAEIIAGHDAVAACLDNLATRRAVNAACVQRGLPFVEAAVAGYSGMLTTVIPGRTACYECLFPTAKQPDGVTAVLGATAGAVGAMQAAAVLALLLGHALPTAGAVLYYDSRSMTTSLVQTKKNPTCTICGRVD